MATTQEYQQICETARSHLNSCNGLVWNDYLNCDSSAVEDVFEAERSEMAYLDHQLAELAAKEHPELRNLKPDVKDDTSDIEELEAESEHCVCEQNAQFHLIPLWDNTSDSTLRRALPTRESTTSSNNQQTPDTKSKEDTQDFPPPMAQDYSGSGWLQHATTPSSETPANAILMCRTCDKPHAEAAAQAKRVLAERIESTQSACSTCTEPQHECHCRRHEIMREPEGEEPHLNLHPRRRSSGRSWTGL